MRWFFGAVWVSSAFSLDRSTADQPAAPQPPLAGIWLGTIEVSQFQIRLVLHVEQDDQGAFTATMDSPDQGAKGLKVDTVSRDGASVRLELKALAAVFAGQMAADGQSLVGTWTQGPAKLPITWQRQEREPDFGRPQDPRPPFPYLIEDVSYENTTAKVTFGGTLLLPRAKRPVPAVLLISGSGAQDRDESILGHRPFLVLADYLARRGIAVLRVDDRGVGQSSGQVATSTTDDFAGAALAGVAYLKTRAEIDPTKIGLCGHSEGGMVAPLAASRSTDVAFIVMLAGTGVTGEQILYRQGEMLAKAQGSDPLATVGTRIAQQKLFAIMKSVSDPIERTARLKKELATMLGVAQAKPEDRAALEAVVAGQLAEMTSPWFRFFLTYDPLPPLRSVRCPVLALNGEKDLQVDPRQNLPPIEEALKAGGNSDYTVQELPGLNHLFQHAETGSPTEYSKIAETFSPEALEQIAAWIAKRTGAQSP